MIEGSTEFQAKPLDTRCRRIYLHGNPSSALLPDAQPRWRHLNLTDGRRHAWGHVGQAGLLHKITGMRFVFSIQPSANYSNQLLYVNESPPTSLMQAVMTGNGFPSANVCTERGPPMGASNPASSPGPFCTDYWLSSARTVSKCHYIPHCHFTVSFGPHILRKRGMQWRGPFISIRLA